MYRLNTDRDEDGSPILLTQSPDTHHRKASTVFNQIKLKRVQVEDELPSVSQQIMYISQLLRQIPCQSEQDESLVAQDDLEQKAFYPYHHGQQHSKLSHLWFWHLIMYAKILYTRVLKNNQKIRPEHLPRLSMEEDVSHTFLEAQRDSKRFQLITWNDLIKIIFLGPLKRTVLFVVIGFLVEAAGKNSLSIILSLIVTDIYNNDQASAYQNTIILIFIILLGLLARHHGYYQAMRFSSKARMTLVNLIYQKITTLSSNSIKDANIGKILNIVGADINNLDFSFMLFFQTLMIPFHFLFGSVILWTRYEGPVGLLALAIICIAYPIQITLQGKTINYLRQFKQKQDARLKLTNEFIEGIKMIKMYAWEQAFQKMVNIIRMEEFYLLLKYQLGAAFDRSINFYSQVWSSCVFFIILYYGNFRTNISTSDMIATIYQLNYFQISCVFMFSYGLQASINIKLVFERITNILNVKTQDMQCLKSIEYVNENRPLIEFKDFNSYWTVTINENNKPALKDINLVINSGEVWAVVGKVGSGKSTLISTLLQQIPQYEGYLKLKGNDLNQSDVKFAYVEQEPFIFPDTIKNNILFGREYNRELYNKVVYASCLEHDIIQMNRQDETEIGEKGLNLSGGQKVRLSLARALYSMADVYLLDDPLSAVDAHVARNMFNLAIYEFIMKEQIKYHPKKEKPAVVLITHQVQYALKCDKIAVLSEGAIILQGTPGDINNQLNEINREILEELNKGKNPSDQLFVKQNPLRFRKSIIQKNVDNLPSKEQELEVTIKTFMRYFSYWSYPMLFILLFLFLSAETINQTYLKIVSNFITYQDENNQGQGFFILGMLALGLYLNNLIKYTLHTISAQYTTKKIHEEMFQKISTVPMEYYDSNPSGRIISCFSNDLGLTDTQTNMVLLDVFETTVYFIGCLIAISVVSQYFIILIVIIISTDIFIFKIYKTIISQLREVELSQRSPLLEFLKKTFGGIIQIQIYAQQSWFTKQFLLITNKLNISSLTFLYSVRGFGFAIDSVGFVIQVIGFILILETKANDHAGFAQAMLLLTIYNDSMSWGLRQAILFKTQMNSYNRMFQIIDLNPEVSNISTDTNSDFPKDGQIEFNDVHMKYRQSSEDILKGLTFTIKSGEKIGCVGRTGAGKSSIIQSIFRMTEIQQGSIKISNIDISTIGLSILRSNIAIIPQSPFLFSGTIRNNLDPLSQFSDDQLWSALKDADLYEHILKFKNGLETDITDVNQGFSVGQKQLICLARIVLTRRKIIVLDEATANVDMMTDELIQKKLKEKFQDCTILTIAHRLNTIADYDRVMVLNDGLIQEFASPYELLAQSLNSSTIDTNTKFAQLVQNTGSQNSNNIFQIAKAHELRKYENTNK